MASQSILPGSSTDEATLLRWRRTVLRLSDHFTTVAGTHPDLAPFLIEGLGNALEQILLFSRERDLLVLEEWLEWENESA